MVNISIKDPYKNKFFNVLSNLKKCRDLETKRFKNCCRREGGHPDFLQNN